MTKKETDKALIEWLDSKKPQVRWQYHSRFLTWLEYCKLKGIPETATEQLEDIKKRILSLLALFAINGYIKTKNI